MFDLSWVKIPAGSVKCRELRAASQTLMQLQSMFFIYDRQNISTEAVCTWRLISGRAWTNVAWTKPLRAIMKEQRRVYNVQTQCFCLIEPLLLLKNTQTLMLMKCVVILSQTTK